MPVLLLTVHKHSTDRLLFTAAQLPAHHTGKAAQRRLCMLQVASLTAEHLVGDNKYFCEHCNAKCDADRQMVLSTVPPYLCLSLQRFVFDYKVSSK